ncbi:MULTISPECIES: hypothetical protein [Nocardiaceae]|uniref:Ribosomal protein L7/L12 n=1 Tax=Rhodococcoides corynebacterioides TaxID=53972 RepID=A0ABS2KU98_9NOCA|nr:MULTISPECIES: hypothetical protein [Rhodococcus]MBM7415452.1 ribosomal protein L7/L12 [Rhodococcus corynebacterioides]MBP1117914.1 ribosomal protein L7/L12 [Rhodococcus sp. PvP016]
MTDRPWFERPAVEKAGTTFFLVFFAALVLPDAVSALVSAPSWWHVAKATACVVLVAYAGTAFVRAWFLGGSAQSTRLIPSLDPAEVPRADVETAVASAPSRVMAVKALRETHPGLGLREASLLVDAARRPPTDGP